LFGTYVSDPETVVRPKHLDFDESQRSVHAAAEAVTRGPRTLIETAPAATIGYDEVKRRNAEWTGDAVSLKARERTVAQLLKEVRWANLGWVYQVSTVAEFI
jgi:alkylated DNA repair protein alkB family protein 1